MSSSAAGSGRGPGFDREQATTVVAAFVASRVVLVVAWVVTTVATGRGGADRLGEGLLAWDGQWYLRIAEQGYRPGGEEVRFWPLLPVLGRLVGSVVGGAEVGLVVVANVAALVALVLLARLATEATADPALAARAVWALALWPASFVLAFAYAESLLLVASLAVALAARRRRWWLVALAGLVAGVTRPNGLLVVVLCAGYALPALRHRPWPGPAEVVARVAAAASPAAGFAVVLALAARWHGDALAPLSSQAPLRGDVVDPATRLVRGVGDLLGDERFGDGLHLPFAVVAAALVVVAVRRVGRVEAAYSGLVVLVAVSAENWNSLERYVLNAFPLFWALGAVAVSRTVERCLLVAGTAGLVGLAVLAWTGDYVP